MWDTLQAFVEAQGYTVSRGDCGGANGVTMFDTRQVRVRADLDDAGACKTLAHEAGHVLLHAPEQRQPFACRGVAEVEAESVAFMVTAAHGLDASQYTFNYVAGWAHQAATPDGPSVEDIVKATGQRVIGATDRILQATQPAPTLVDEALADLAVQVSRPLDAVTLPRAPPSTLPTPPSDRPGRRTSGRLRVAGGVRAGGGVGTRDDTGRLDGAARERQALPRQSVRSGARAAPLTRDHLLEGAFDGVRRDAQPVPVPDQRAGWPRGTGAQGRPLLRVRLPGVPRPVVVTARGARPRVRPAPRLLPRTTPGQRSPPRGTHAGRRTRRVRGTTTAAPDAAGPDAPACGSGSTARGPRRPTPPTAGSRTVRPAAGVGAMSMDADTPEVVRVPTWFLNAEELAATRAKIAKLQQRAARKGFTGRIDLDATPATRSHQSPGGLPVTVHGFDVTITGEPPRYAGWRFVAAVDAVEGGTILRYPPGAPAEVPNDQIRAGECDHCHTTRARRSTVLVAHEDTGQLLQVGRSCLKDFLGHNTLPVFLTTDDVAITLGGNLAGIAAAWDVHSVLAYAAAAVEAFGWTPASASEHGRVPTRDQVRLALKGGRGADQLRDQLAPHLADATTRAPRSAPTC